jgi:hypothetical protein
LAENLRLDRVSLGAKDVAATAQWLETVAGLHAREAWLFRTGLINRIAYSGAAAIEIMGVGFPGAEMVSPFVGQVYGRTIAGDRWITWTIQTDDIHATALRLGLEVMDGWAMSSAGQAVTWQMAGLTEAFFSEPYLPYFVSYTNGDEAWRERALEPEPSFDVASIDISGDAARLAEWLGGADVPVAVTAGAPEIRSVVINADGTEIDLRPGYDSRD